MNRNQFQSSLSLNISSPGRTSTVLDFYRRIRIRKNCSTINKYYFLRMSLHITNTIFIHSRASHADVEHGDGDAATAQYNHPNINSEEDWRHASILPYTKDWQTEMEKWRCVEIEWSLKLLQLLSGAANETFCRQIAEWNAIFVHTASTMGDCDGLVCIVSRVHSSILDVTCIHCHNTQCSRSVVEQKVR